MLNKIKDTIQNKCFKNSKDPTEKQTIKACKKISMLREFPKIDLSSVYKYPYTDQHRCEFIFLNHFLPQGFEKIKAVFYIKEPVSCEVNFIFRYGLT